MRKLTVPLLLILVLALSACFKNAGSDTPTAQPISLVSSGGIVVQPTIETPQAMPTTEVVVTEEVTEVAVEPTETPTKEPTEAPTEVVVAPTFTPTIFVPPTSTATNTSRATVFVPLGPQASLTLISGQGGGPEEETGEAIPLGEPTQEVFNPTQIAMLQPTSTPTATNTLIPTNTSTATNTSIPTNTPAPPSSTPIVSTLGQPTLTTVPLVALDTQPENVGQGGQLVEATATTVELAQLPTQELTVNQMTATAVILNATATANAFFALQTQQAGGVVPTSPVLLTPGVTVQVQPTVQTTDCEYLVQIGETLSQIARRYNLTIDQIANYNNITNPNLIRAGYPIIIPGCGLLTPTTAPATPISSGQGGLVVTPTQPLDNSQGPFTYTVQAGDNIYRISVRYGITMRELLSANPQISDMNFISEGQRITVPGPPTQFTPVPQTNVVQPTQAVVPQQIFTPTFTPGG